MREEAKDVIDDGGPAFPGPEIDDGIPMESGMSLRDYFAAKASDDAVSYFVRGYIGSLKTNEPDDWVNVPTWSEWHCRKIAAIESRYRYALADAMLEERAKA